MTANTQPIDETDVEQTIKPLLFGPTAEWFEDITEQYYLESGGMGRVTDITPHAITFAWVNNGDNTKFYPKRVNGFQSLIAEDSEMVVVENEDEAQSHDTPTTWTKQTDNIYIWERIPFSDPPVTTREQLESELTDILIEGSYIESKLDKAAEVSTDM